jgi:hypothetical protein
MYHHSTFTDGSKTIISVSCRECLQKKQFDVETAHYDAWAAGALIQRAMPEISEDDRELLISGMCGTCFDSMFEDDAEDYS